MSTFAALLPLILLPAALAQAPADVAGWGKIKWGMSLEDVRAAYGPDLTITRDAYWAHVALPPIRIADTTFQASASAKLPSPGVTLVSLWSTFDTGAGPAEFDTLKTLLIQKYGRRKNEEHKIEFDDPVHAFLWIFPSTAIQLKLTQKRRIPTFGMITIEYRALDTKSLDAL